MTYDLAKLSHDLAGGGGISLWNTGGTVQFILGFGGDRGNDSHAFAGGDGYVCQDYHKVFGQAVCHACGDGLTQYWGSFVAVGMVTVNFKILFNANGLADSLLNISANLSFSQ